MHVALCIIFAPELFAINRLHSRNFPSASHCSVCADACRRVPPPLLPLLDYQTSTSVCWTTVTDHARTRVVISMVATSVPARDCPARASPRIIIRVRTLDRAPSTTLAAPTLVCPRWDACSVSVPTDLCWPTIGRPAKVTCCPSRDP